MIKYKNIQNKFHLLFNGFSFAVRHGQRFPEAEFMHIQFR
jgi:hypothetical protein